MYILLIFYQPMMMNKLSLKWANKIMVDDTENVLKLLCCNLDICIKESRDMPLLIDFLENIHMDEYDDVKLHTMMPLSHNKCE